MATNKKQENPKFMLNGKEIDLRHCMPWTLRDSKTMKKAGVDIKKCDPTENPENTALFLLHLFQKNNPSVTEDDVDTLSLREIGSILNTMENLDKELDRPS